MHLGGASARPGGPRPVRGRTASGARRFEDGGGIFVRGKSSQNDAAAHNGQRVRVDAPTTLPPPLAVIFCSQIRVVPERKGARRGDDKEADATNTGLHR